MREKRALLPLVFFLILPLSAAHIDWTIYSKESEPSSGDLLVEITEGEINPDYDGEYRDGLVDNFDYFINRGYPSGYTQTAGSIGVGKYVL